MTILRAGTLLLLPGFAAPVALVWQSPPAHAEDGGGDSDGGESDGGDDAEEATEEEIRARQAAPAPAPAVDFTADTATRSLSAIPTPP